MMSSVQYSSSQIVCIFIAICCILTACEGFLSPQQILPTRQSLNDQQQQQHDERTGSKPTSSSSVVFLSAASRTSKNGPSTFKGKRNTKGNNKGKKPNKWDRRRGKENFTARNEVLAAQPRPVLTNYGEQRNSLVNDRRLNSSAGNINCEHFESCPGCVTDTSVGKTDIVRSAARFFSSTAIRKNRIDVERSGEEWVVEDEDDGFYELVVPTETTEWRTQAKLVAAPKSGSGGQWAKDGCMFGLYQRGTHKVMDIPNCKVHHPSINRAIEALEKATERTGTPPYTDDNGLRYIQLQVERTTGKVSLTLVWGTQDIKWTQPALSRLTKELLKAEPDLWHSMWCHCNDGPGNNIFSRNPRNWHRLTGHEFVREPLPVGNLGWLYFSPLAFRQGNIDGFDIIANDVARAVPGGSKVCELYAGVGMLGLTSLVFHHLNHEKYRDEVDGYGEPLTWVRCSDENPANPRCFSASVRSL
jgi:23S rRNA (uracil1939-C5)-methyltransferase